MNGFKKIIWILVVLAGCLLPTTLSYATSNDEWTKNTLIAHALGGIGEDTHINSMDAMEQSYQKGFKVFEADLTLTSDDQLVANHDWSGYTTPPTYAKFMASKVLGKYTPTNVDEILDFLSNHPDMYLITDTKEVDPVLIRKQFTILTEKAKEKDPTILDRIIPEIYNPQMYDIVQSIYPFKNKYYSIYLLGDTEKDRKDIIQFMLDHNIRTLTMPVERLDESYMKLINRFGLKLYVFTVNSPDQITKLEKMGVHGFYTDFLTPSTSPKPSLLAKVVMSLNKGLNLTNWLV